MILAEEPEAAMTGKMKEKTVTQTDIARELNISVVSVSNALNGRPGVSNELRQKIMDTAQEMGYRSSGVQPLPGSGTDACIGVLISKRYLLYTPSFYMKVYQEIVLAAAERNCVTFLEVLDAQDEDELKIPELLGDEKVDGILVVGELKHPFTRHIREASSVPVVFVDYYEDLPDTDFSYTGTCYLTRRMLEAGYRDIAFVGTISATSSIMDRYLGYRKALMEQSLEIRPEWIIPDREKDGDRLFVKLPENMPQAFVCNCDKTAGILIARLRDAGYRVPEDIGVAGFDNFLMEEIEGISLTTYDVDMGAMARVSVNTLLNKIRHPYFTSRLRVISGRMVCGNSFSHPGRECLWKK